MEKNRIEAFSDAVIAIIITIMVLELKVPEEYSLEVLQRIWPAFGAYALSYLIIYLIWLSHHSIFSQLKMVNRPLLIANGLLLFSVSLIPFVTAFAGEAHWTEPVPVVLYGLIMASVSAALSYLRHIASSISLENEQSKFHCIKNRISNLIAIVFFLIGAGASWFAPRWALIFYAAVPFMLMALRSKPKKNIENS